MPYGVSHKIAHAFPSAFRMGFYDFLADLPHLDGQFDALVLGRVRGHSEKAFAVAI